MPCNCADLSRTHEHITRHTGGDPTAAQHVSLNSLIDLGAACFFNVQEPRAIAVRVMDPAFLNNSGAAASASNAPPLDGEGITSDADEEVLITIAFSDFVRLRGVSIVGPGDSQSPAAVKLFANRGGDVSGFDSVRRLVPDQSMGLANGAAATDLLYLVDPHKFGNVSTLALLIDANYGADETRLLRLEFFGESTGQPVAKQLASNVVYDSGRNPADYREYVEDAKGRAQQLGM